MNQDRISKLCSVSAVSLAASLALIACGDDGSDPGSGETEAATDGGGTDAQPRVSYYEHVRPLLNEHCVSCHSDGSIAPFRLDNYASVAEVASLVRAVIEARTMPPFGIRADGTCQDWRDPRWLSDDEISTIATWVDEGVEPGDDTIAAPVAPQLPTLDGDGVEVIEMPEYRPQGSPDVGLDLDDYRCFLVEFDTTEDRYLTGFDIVPGNDELAHHVLGFRVDPNILGNGDRIAELDAQTPGPGWDCFGAAGDGVLPQGVPVTWAPGQGAVQYPDNIGVKFSPGDVMVVQMHYNLAEADGIDATEIKLNWTDEVEREGFQILWDPLLFGAVGGGGETIPAGMSSAKYAWNASFGEMLSFDGLEFDSIDVLGLIPHMHAHGRKMSINIDRAERAQDGPMECAADVDRYDYNWQRTYFYEDAINVTMADALDVVCDFDTRSAADPVAAGFGTQDEMCLVGIFFTAGG